MYTISFQPKCRDINITQGCW